MCHENDFENPSVCDGDRLLRKLVAYFLLDIIRENMLTSVVFIVLRMLRFVLSVSRSSGRKATKLVVRQSSVKKL